MCLHGQLIISQPRLYTNTPKYSTIFSFYILVLSSSNSSPHNDLVLIMVNIDSKNRLSDVSDWFRNLKSSICKEFEQIEKELAGTFNDRPCGSFKTKNWNYEHGSGTGEINVMKGRVFEKVGVVISTITEGKLMPELREKIPGTKENNTFQSCGISLVAHMQSPLVPAVHMNTRFIKTGKEWFGGGADLNPSIENPSDTKFFHSNLEEMCNKYDRDYYAKFKKWCDEYFLIKHRNEPRGVGGIFYDYLDTSDFENKFNFTQDVGRTFLKTYASIVRKHMNREWTEEQKKIQLFKRGRYAEFNLLYDRGTKFGLLSGGNPEAIFISMPPLASWS